MSGLTLLALLLQCLLLPAFAEPTDAPADPTEPSASETVADATEPDASEPGATDAAEPTAETAAPAENDKAPAAVTDEMPPALNDFGQYLDTTVQAKAAALVELNSDTLVYGMNLDEKLYPASLTKIMTCMLALEHGNLDDIVTVSHEALQDLNAAGSSAGLLEGEQLSLRELLYCVMISSANEACNVVAEYIAGDIPSFVALMNAQAAALGMTGTHFANAHGLHDENHYTTVRDLVTLARWAWQSEQFQEFSTQTSHTVPATNKSEERVLRTTNYLTSGQTVGKYYYDKARGIKTGFTTPAGGCLISTAESGSLHFLSVVCGCETLQNDDGTETDQRFTETKRLFEYGFNHLNSVQVLADTALVDMPQVLYADGRDSVVVRAKDNISVLLPDSCDTSGITLTVQYDSEAPLEAPLEAETKVGTVSAVLDGKVLATCDLVTLTAVMRSTPKYVAKQTESVLAKIWKGMWRLWFVTVPVLLALVFWLIVAILRSVNRRRAKKRHARAASVEPVRAGRTAVDELNVLRMSCEGLHGLRPSRHAPQCRVRRRTMPLARRLHREGPGQQEDLRGEPSVGPAGQLLDDMLSIIDLGRHNCYICNIVKCRPPGNRDPQPQEQDACFGWLERQLRLLQPSIIVCLGRIAAMRLIRPDFRITREHGQWFERNGVRCLAMYHPSALLRDPARRPETYTDLLTLREAVRTLGPLPNA